MRMPIDRRTRGVVNRGWVERLERRAAIGGPERRRVQRGDHDAAVLLEREVAAGTAQVRPRLRQPLGRLAPLR